MADEGSLVGRILWRGTIVFAVVVSILAIAHGLTLDGPESRRYWVGFAASVIFSGAVLGALLVASAIFDRIERRRGSRGRGTDGTRGDGPDRSGSDEFGCGSDSDSGDGGGD